MSPDHTPTSSSAGETAAERIELLGGWFLEHNGMSAPHRRYWLNHPEKGALFHIDTRYCEPEFQDFVTSLAPKPAAAEEIERVEHAFKIILGFDSDLALDAACIAVKALSRPAAPASEVAAEPGDEDEPNGYVSSLLIYSRIAEAKGLHVEASGMREIAKWIKQEDARLADLRATAETGGAVVPDEVRRLANIAARDDLLDAGLQDNKWKFALAASTWVRNLIAAQPEQPTTTEGRP